jgi:hypothetical protein
MMNLCRIQGRQTDAIYSRRSSVSAGRSRENTSVYDESRDSSFDTAADSSYRSTNSASRAAVSSNSTYNSAPDNVTPEADKVTKDDKLKATDEG